MGGEIQEFPQAEGPTLGTNWLEEMGTMAWMSQEAAVLGNKPWCPVASDLMSSPLRKRIRSPDLRDALSAGLPGGKKKGHAGQQGRAHSCLPGEKWDRWQSRAKFRPAACPHWTQCLCVLSCSRWEVILGQGWERLGPMDCGHCQERKGMIREDFLGERYGEKSFPGT